MENLSETNETANAPVESFGAAAVTTAEENNQPAHVEAQADGGETSETSETSEQTPALYDADAHQRQTFTIEENGQKFETTHVFAPLTDERYFEFAKAAKTVVTDDGNSVVTRTIEAAVELFDDLIEDVLGFDGDKPANWKDLLDPTGEKLPSINELLVSAVVEAEEPEEAEEPAAHKRRSWNGAGDSAVTLESYFNGAEVRTKHFLRKKSIADAKTFERLYKMPSAAAANKSRKGLKSGGDVIMPSYAKAKAALYDQMQTRTADGYASRVPAHHKIAVVDYVFRSSFDAKK